MALHPRPVTSGASGETGLTSHRKRLEDYDIYRSLGRICSPRAVGSLALFGPDYDVRLPLKH